MFVLFISGMLIYFPTMDKDIQISQIEKSLNAKNQYVKLSSDGFVKDKDLTEISKSLGFFALTLFFLMLMLIPTSEFKRDTSPSRGWAPWPQF